MDIRLDINPSMRATHLKNQIATGKAPKPAKNVSGNTCSQDTVRLSSEARAAYTAQNNAATKNAAATSPEAQASGESVRVNGIMMKDGKWDDSETTFSSILKEMVKIENAVKAQGGTLIGTHIGQVEMMAIQSTRNQISQSVQELIAKNGITIPEGQSFEMRVLGMNDDFYIHVDGLDDPELTEAVEKAINVGNNGFYLHRHISESRQLTNSFGLTSQSPEEALSEAKESLDYMVRDLTGYDIRTLPREDGHIFTPDGQDLWDVLLEKASNYQMPDGTAGINISRYRTLYNRIAMLGWDCIPDRSLGLRYQDGGLYDIGTDYGFGPGQTGWQDWARDHAEELAARIMSGLERQISGGTAYPGAVKR